MKLLKTVKRVISSSSKRQSVISAFEEENSQCSKEWRDAIPYKDVPGPKPLLFLGNTWRFIPYIGTVNCN